jgi:hypothetical protein
MTPSRGLCVLSYGEVSFCGGVHESGGSGYHLSLSLSLCARAICKHMVLIQQRVAAVKQRGSNDAATRGADLGIDELSLTRQGADLALWWWWWQRSRSQQVVAALA